MDSINWTEFRKLTPEQLKSLKSYEVTYEGEYMFTFINPGTEYCRGVAMNISNISNSVAGLELADVLQQVEEQTKPTQKKRKKRKKRGK